MKQLVLTGLGLAVGLSITSASAAVFQCPHVGGNFTFGESANFNSLDQMATGTESTRNIAMNIFETLMTRGENGKPILQLAQSVTKSLDGMTYTFELRQGVHFQNGHLMTSADVVASFDRYAKVGLNSGILADVESWSAPNKYTFVVHMKRVDPTFLLLLSDFSIPIVIIPASEENVPALQLKPIGTGPYELVKVVPGSYVELRRFPGYSPDTRYSGANGFGGYKQACFNTVTFRIVTEPGALVAGIETGQLQGAENIPAKSVAALRKNKDVKILKLPNWWITVAEVNTATPPTNNLDFRKAVQAGLNMKAIMQGATDGNYRLNVGFQYPGQFDYSDAGKSTYNINNPTLAKEYLRKSGYKGEAVTLLTDTTYPQLYNAAIVMQQELKALGIDAKLLVTDWPTSKHIQLNKPSAWNFFFDAWGTQPAVGGLSMMQTFARQRAIYFPPPGHPDPEVQKLWKALTLAPTSAERLHAFSAMQKYVLDQVYMIPFGSYTQIQAVRSDVKGYVPYRIPRVYNVWFQQ